MKRLYLLTLTTCLLLVWSVAHAQNGNVGSPHGNLSLDCNDCHTTEGWKQIKANPAFNHQTTHFPLVGRHNQVQCESCHKSLVFDQAGTQCKDCHLDIHSGQFAYACSECHTPSQWNNEREMFQRHQQTRFALTGVHANVDCQACHSTGQYVGLATECASCHLQTFEATTNPNHVTSHLSTNCAQCHNVSAARWLNATFTDHAASGFSLTGQHNVITCDACHVNGNFATVPTDCYSCHSANFQSVFDPNHVMGNFGHNCAVCHTTGAWRPAIFDHSLSGFALTGAHATTDCAPCHTLNGQPRFTGTPSDCFSCHTANFQGTTNPNHVTLNISHNCTQCHTTAPGWQPATFDHSIVSYSLTGAHTSLQCQQCHTGSQFANTPTDCYTCHTATFNGATNPDHAAQNFPHDCTVCHNTSVWQPSTFNHATSVFPLTGAHVTAQCNLCHTNGQFANTPSDCYTCHTATFNGATNPDHAAQNFPHDCTVCHNTSAWQPSTFNHATSVFPLTGAHATVQCNLCHTNGQFANTPTDCYTCHTATFNGATNPDHVSQNFPHDCTVCHNTTAWQPSTFNHATSTFPLTGAHASLQCAQCHANGQFANTPTDCYTCHTASFNQANSPNHVSQNFPHDCTICHNTAAWQPSTFNHQTSAFPLTGRHTSAACTQCHVNGQYVGTPTDCYSCHRANYEATRDPNHVALGYSHDCTQCHTTNGWDDGGGGFPHNTTGFPLTGSHATAQCTACHAGGRFLGTPTECYLCHRENYDGAGTPSHATGNFSHICTRCHTTSAWQPSTFTHNSTPFQLNGAHVTVPCQSCHRSGPFSQTPADCYSCHQANFNGVTNPNHVTNQFDHNCTVCHSNAGWNPATFNHSTTGFPLSGAHTSTPCSNCHAGGRFAGTPTECYVCHRENYDGAGTPSHATGNFSHICTRCHTTSAWQPSTFTHNSTPFQLNGAHVAVPCQSCHRSGPFSQTPADCYSCHQANFNGVTDPNHVTNQFDHNCTACHNTAAWNPATFDHNTTAFPLTGAHGSTACVLCHVGGQYHGTPTDCYSCHQANFNGVTDPNHVTNQFDHNCTACHNTAAWNPATFDHNTTAFPLTGAHGSTACVLCHVGGQYHGTPTDCYSCHQANFNGVTDPNHVTNQFDHNCTACHNTAAWNPATFDHSTTTFPLTGAHVSTACVLCHVGGQYHGTPTDCYSCHQANFNGVTDPNHVTNQFDHNCTVCHNTAAWNPATFDHNTTAFPLTGAHASTACALCHVGGQYHGTPTDCYSCHQANFNGVTDPNHVTNQFDHNCTVCHNTAAWNPATFDHSTTTFPLTGAHVSVACNLCHVNGQYQGTPTDCYFCHQTDYNNATPSHSAAGFPTTCQTCHTTSAWTGATFNHDGQWFPIYSGHHQGRWSTCADCHTNPNDFAVFSCITCHAHNQQNMNNEHQGVSGYVYESGHCYTCHPNGGGGGLRVNPQPRGRAR